MLLAAATMFSKDGRTCFHSLVFSPQSGLTQMYSALPDRMPVSMKDLILSPMNLALHTQRKALSFSSNLP